MVVGKVVLVLVELIGNICGGVRVCVVGLWEGYIIVRFFKDGLFFYVKEFFLFFIIGVCCELVGYVEVEWSWLVLFFFYVCFRVIEFIFLFLFVLVCVCCCIDSLESFMVCFFCCWFCLCFFWEFIVIYVWWVFIERVEVWSCFFEKDLRVW